MTYLGCSATCCAPPDRHEEECAAELERREAAGVLEPRSRGVARTRGSEAQITALGACC
jgi:hypothetical protein